MTFLFLFLGYFRDVSVSILSQYFSFTLYLDESSELLGQSRGIIPFNWPPWSDCIGTLFSPENDNKRPHKSKIQSIKINFL